MTDDSEGARKGILLWLYPMDQEIVGDYRRRYDCSTSTAIRTLLRIGHEEVQKRSLNNRG